MIVLNKVWELHNEGWGYTKIHRYLGENNFKVDRSKTIIYSMIKKELNKKRF